MLTVLENPVVTQIRDLLQKALTPTHLEVIDDSAAHAGHAGAMEHPEAGHYRVIITSEAFVGKSSIARHRMIYQALGDLMHRRIHALVLETKTPNA